MKLQDNGFPCEHTNIPLVKKNPFPTLETSFNLTDKFEVKATGHSTARDRIWTLIAFSNAQFVADQAVRKLGYERAEVVNTFGGRRSNALYVAEKTGSHLTEES